MSERYTRLFALPENLYAAGSPVLLSAGALLKDNQAGRVLVQLKLRSLSPMNIKAVKVSVRPFDTVCAPLGEAVEHQYLDLTAARGDEFGTKSPIVMPDAATRSFSAVVTEVAFADNRVWRADGAPWEPLPIPQPLDAALEDAELVKQFRMTYGEDCKCLPMEHKDLWYCTCGARNRREEAVCHRCSRERAARDERLAAEAEKAEAAEEAARIRAKKAKKAAPIVAAAIVVAVLLTTKAIIPAAKYNAAVYLMEAGSVVDAYEALIAMDGYKDSAEKANSIYGAYKSEKLKCAQVGDYVFFGTYEQDGNKSNGKEDIEWLVLDVQDGKALVISKYALDCQPYNTELAYVPWATCTLRKWLNKDFLNAAFSAEERAMIPTVTVPADKNPSYSTDPGTATQEKVFLLSIQEANKYFASDSARQCAATDYAVANGAYVNSDNGNCWWWLRSGYGYYYTAHAAYIDLDGGIDEVGDYVNRRYNAVRPAIWVNIGS